MTDPWQPEYIWVRKDQYKPGLFESLRSRSPAPTKEEKEMEARIAKLEEDLKKRGVAPQMAYPPQTVYMPNAVGYPAAVAYDDLQLPVTEDEEARGYTAPRGSN